MIRATGKAMTSKGRTVNVILIGLGAQDIEILMSGEPVKMDSDEVIDHEIVVFMGDYAGALELALKQLMGSYGELVEMPDSREVH